MSAQTKQAFAQWFLSLGGAANWFGTDKVNAWASGNISSVVFDNLYTQWFNGNTQFVIGYVQQHTGLAMPDQFQNWKNNSIYVPVINVLTVDLNNYQTQQQNIHGTSDDTILANQAISENIVRTQQALAYYKQLASQ